MTSMFLSRNLDEDSEIHIDYVDPDAPQATPPSSEATRRDEEFRARLCRIRDDITLPDQFRIRIERDQQHPGGRFYFQIEAERLDTFTGEPGTGRGGKAYLSENATDSELIQTLFGLYNAYLHHEARETFQWRGRRVFGPHIDVAAHWEIAERYDARRAPT